PIMSTWPKISVYHIISLTVVVIVLTITAGCSREKNAWETAKTKDTKVAYEAVLNKYPEGEFSTLAQAALQKLRDKLTPREVVAKIEAAIKDLAPGAFRVEWNWCTLYSWYDFKSMEPAGAAFVFKEGGYLGPNPRYDTEIEPRDVMA
ncbi:MAG: hypothetical protein RMJ46_07685, partial [Bacteroidota bacterium]|nr:hypothetical protein [Bacteroidota bacterium]